MQDQQIARRLAAWRDLLLDLTKRNPLVTLPKSVYPLEQSPSFLWDLPLPGKKGGLLFVSQVKQATLLFDVEQTHQQNKPKVKHLFPLYLHLRYLHHRMDC